MFGSIPAKPYVRGAARALAGLAACTGLLAIATAADGAARPPVIRHEPVRVAVAGQALSVRAEVTSETGIKAVALLFSTSRDAAPFRSAMHDAGGGFYVGNIPAGVLSGLKEISYYIEATDRDDVSSETPWCTVSLQNANSAAAAVGTEGGSTNGRAWKKTALYAGGAAALIGGGLWAISAGGDSGGGGSGTSTTNVGTFAGSVTITREVSGEASTTTSHSMSIQILSNGTVSSDNMYDGQHLEGTLAGQTFLLIAAVSDSGFSGQISFFGTVVGARIVGSVSGLATSTGGAQAAYTGTFSANKVAAGE